ncbi:MAG: helix-turn-helix domain-containing protein [Bdellovibrionota bacterium]
MSQREGTNYYELLEVTPDAHSSEIHKAYQRAKQTYSQDNPALYSMFSPEEARELLRLIDEAYQVLNNAGTRKAYDDSLKGTGAPPPAPRQPTPQAPAATKSAYSQTTVSAPASQVQSHGIGAANPPSMNGEAYMVRPPQGTRNAPPAGTGRTQHSNYKLDDAFETEITGATEFDGALLQRIRVYKNISLEKLSESTRISKTYLTAVEQNDFKALPAAVFVRGFIVQVARQLGLDEKKVAESYMKGFKAGGGK